ncbi:Acetyltransferase (GNAT) family protein [Pustulibacterium marinum]|uniref:Acetyltransferase (GNAT) family protein n=1 Tax=Pustulibacterium marinum TaxID=1224947 RepID=A0A1I7HLP2_9FLAO|nr:GNAT family N-acetyltransferase [Pustulibacterium marinum]SFU61582.1 Acetyltransferase (GNAT) family protein [Pustulibacterium marinum]
MESPVSIVAFTTEERDAIRKLNYEWLERYFKLEPGDVKSLNNPETEILAKGGYIFYAKYEGNIVGCVALMKKTDRVFELSKMAVTETIQGLGIGKLLLEYCLDFAANHHFLKLIIYSNTKLKSAIHLYQKYGFEEIPLESGLYERADIKLEKYM